MRVRGRAGVGLPIARIVYHHLQRRHVARVQSIQHGHECRQPPHLPSLAKAFACFGRNGVYKNEAKRKEGA